MFQAPDASGETGLDSCQFVPIRANSCQFVPVVVSSCLDYDQIVETMSPNGKLKAIAFRRNCGATTAYSTHVSLLPSGRELRNDPGNVFTGSHERLVAARWIDDNHLIISGHTETEFLHRGEFNGIKITYE